ncbi:hypothetical protein Tco_1062627 [Tanacetum coccineum]
MVSQMRWFVDDDQCTCSPSAIYRHHSADFATHGVRNHQFKLRYTGETTLKSIFLDIIDKAFPTTTAVSLGMQRTKAKGKERKKILIPLVNVVVLAASMLDLSVWQGWYGHRTKDDGIAEGNLLSLFHQLEPEKIGSSGQYPYSQELCHMLQRPNEEQNEEQVNAVVDGSDLKMADGAAPSKSGGVFVQGVSHVLDDVVKATTVESELISSILDVVVALSVGGKGDGSVPSSTVEEVVVPPFDV